MKALLMLLPLMLAACMAGPDATTRAATAPQADAAVTISSATLSRHHWQLHDAVDGSNKRLDALLGQPDKPLQLDFSADRISVSNACNRISGSYRIVEGHLVTTPLLQTRMACADPTLTQRETTITTMLQGGPTLILSSAGHTPLLTLADASGQTLTFAGMPATDARSGDDGGTTPQQP